MTLIKSISGIRGTIGGSSGDNLSPEDIVKYTAAYCVFIKKSRSKERLQIVIGRDARISGMMVSMHVAGTLMAMGADVTDCGLSTTPSVEMAVIDAGADGGIIITASHNPQQWNALKLLNASGEFLSAAEAQEVLTIADSSQMEWTQAARLGQYSRDDHSMKRHIEKILAMPLVDREAISKAGLHVAVDGINSTGGLAVPLLLHALGVKKICRLNCDPDGYFMHNPEPLPEHLSELAELVKEKEAHLGIAVDPDVDRLALVDEKGNMFGEEYTLVAVADYILQHRAGNTVSNLSSTSALRDITKKYGGHYFPSAVGEVNVVEMMKKQQAVIGGEGNGGVIVPELHYGRDALAGIALFLTYLAKTGLACSALRAKFPDYYISKNKIELNDSVDLNALYDELGLAYSDFPQIRIDGLRIDFEAGWVHLRGSNTEPVVRIYAEAGDREKADALAGQIMESMKKLM